MFKKKKISAMLLLLSFIVIGVLFFFIFRNNDWYSFTIPYDDKSDNIINVGKTLLDAPAGKYGFIKTERGHFFYNGTRMRFWGVNLSVEANFPSHREAEKIAAHIAKYGFNIVRLHNFDSANAPEGIFIKGSDNTLSLDETQLDKLDYLVYQLKSRGVYVDMNLFVNRVFTKADGVNAADGLKDNGRYAAMFDPKLIKLQKDYARELLTHYNPYTKTRYNNEPAVAMVEIINESSLFDAWKNGILTYDNKKPESDLLPRYYRSELDREWNSWLAEKYAGTQLLKNAWTLKERIGNNLIDNSQFLLGTGTKWNEEVHADASAKFSIIKEKKGSGRSLRVDILKASDSAASVQLQQNGLALKKGKNYLLTFKARATDNRSITVEYCKSSPKWDNYGLYQGFKINTKWKLKSVVFSSSVDTAADTRLSFMIGNSTGTVWLKDITLTETSCKSTAEYSGKNIIEGFKGNESLEKLNIKRTSWSGRFNCSKQRVNDNTEFYSTLEKDYFDTMLSYLHKDLGIKAPVSTSNTFFGNVDLMAQAEGDFTNSHNYWDAPEFTKELWDRSNFTQNNDSLITKDFSDENRDAGDTFLGTLALSAVKDKPFVVTEWNSVFPNDYQYELPAFLTANALFQDWDGLYLYAYSHNEKDGRWDIYYIYNWFDIDKNPAIMVQAPACATAFIQGNFQSANNSISLIYNRKDIIDDYRSIDDKHCFDKDHITPFGALYKYSIRKSIHSEPETVSIDNIFAPNEIRKLLSESNHKSDTGEITWYGKAEGHEYVLFNADKFQGIDGFVAGKDIITKNVEFNLKTNCSATLVSMDEKPIGSSGRMLLTLAGRIKNTGQKKNIKTNGLKKWGHAPVLMNRIRGEIKILNRKFKYCNIYTLDSKGKRVKRVLDGKNCNKIILSMDSDSTPWYEIECG